MYQSSTNGLAAPITPDQSAQIPLIIGIPKIRPRLFANLGNFLAKGFNRTVGIVRGSFLIGNCKPLLLYHVAIATHPRPETPGAQIIPEPVLMAVAL